MNNYAIYCRSIHTGDKGISLKPLFGGSVGGKNSIEQGVETGGMIVHARMAQFVRNDAVLKILRQHEQFIIKGYVVFTVATTPPALI